MLIFFGTSGDLGYLQRLMTEERFTVEIVAHDDLVRDTGEWSTSPSG
jgi:release factor glutamine methyltransferase